MNIDYDFCFSIFGSLRISSMSRERVAFNVGIMAFSSKHPYNHDNLNNFLELYNKEMRGKKMMVNITNHSYPRYSHFLRTFSPKICVLNLPSKNQTPSFVRLKKCF